jgi:hypothetical protein
VVVVLFICYAAINLYHLGEALCSVNCSGTFLSWSGGHEEFFAEKTHCVSEVGDTLPLKFWTRDGDFGEQALVF